MLILVNIMNIIPTGLYQCIKWLYNYKIIQLCVVQAVVQCRRTWDVIKTVKHGNI